MSVISVGTQVTIEDYLKILDQVRQRTLNLMAPLSEAVIRRQHHPLMSPLIWDMGHVANFEELWLLQELLGRRPYNPEYDYIYNALTKPRKERSTLPLPDLPTTRQYMDDIRRRVRNEIREYDIDPGNSLTANGFIFELVIRHEMQHQETMIITLQIMDQGLFAPPRKRPLPADHPVRQDMMEIPGGEFIMGAPEKGFAYDNERPAHPGEVKPFRLAAYPVTNREYLEFMEAGGYDRKQFWSLAGWTWRQETGVVAPMYWTYTGRDWHLRRFHELIPVPPAEPVMHISYYEAEAYCNFAGKRLPTETEWEYAASMDFTTGRKRRYPWGDEYKEGNANLNQTAFGPAEVGAFPGGGSPAGCLQMIGDQWEWTASDFKAYPGFRAFPYPEYSEIFFGDEYKVLRGGSWAACDRVVSTTFRNWDYPSRRQIFSGFRCAEDLEP